MHQDIKKIMFTEEEISKRVLELADQINKDYQGESIYCIGVLKGSGMFMMDLVRRLEMPIEFDFFTVSSYGNSTESSGCVNIVHDVRISVKDKNILLIEDIVDTGNTLRYLKKCLLDRGCKSVKIATMLDKPSRRVNNLTPEYVGFEVPDAFIVGYGLDYAEKYRNFPYIGILKESVWRK